MEFRSFRSSLRLSQLTRHRYSNHEPSARPHNSTRPSFKLPAARDLAANIGQAILAIESYASRASRHGMFSTRACIKHARFIQRPPRDGTKTKMKWCAPHPCRRLACRRLERRTRPPACSRSRTMVHSCFDPLHVVGEFSCTRIGWPTNSSGRGWRFQGVACGPPRAHAGRSATGQRIVSR